jgi:hypothetical protein
MARCPSYAIDSFLHIASPNSIKIQPVQQPPFQPSFAPQATLQFIDNMITTDSNNTISFQGNVYSLYNDIQFCTGTVRLTGGQGTNAAGRGVYTTNGQAVAADLVLTFVNPAYTPQAILVILPIYPTTAQNSNLVSTLIQQKSTVDSLTSLFTIDNMPSYGYNVCISTVESAENLTINNGITAYVVSFPSGLSIPQADINQLKNLQEYVFRPANGYPIVTSFGFDSETGTYPPKTIDPGTFYFTVVFGNDDKVTKNVTNYAQSPLFYTQSKTAQSVLDQYKCYPLNELQNIKNDASGGTPILNVINEMGKIGPADSAFSSGIGIILWILLGLTIIGTLVIVISYFVTPNQVPVSALEAAAPTAATT